MTVVQCTGLKKSYGAQTVLDDLSFSLKEGSVTFLLGLNGAGKTTLLKLIAGLLYPDAGEIAYKEKKLGSLIDSPKFYGNLSAYDNLRYYAMVQGVNPGNLVKALKAVRLDPNNRKAVKGFSLGMKQRLGIAMALLGDYNLVVLDEPFTGLDPAGMEEIRELIRNINRNTNKTFLISSHLLAEAEGVATDYAILHGGKIVTEFSHANIESVCRRIRATATRDSLNKCLALLAQYGDRLFWRERGSDLWIFLQEATREELESLLALLAGDGPAQVEQCTLKEYFLALTERGSQHAFCS